MKIRFGFYDKKTEFIADELYLDVPEALIFKITETQDIQEIKTFGYDVTPELVEYVLEQRPKIAEKFEKYDAQFTGAP